MGKLGLTGLLLSAALLVSKPSEALLTYEDLDRPPPVTAYGTCIYKKMIWTVDCYQGKGCRTEKVTDLQGNPVEYPQGLCPPDVAFRGGQILFCLDPLPEKCYTPPLPDKCQEKPTISLDCLCC
ncbi:hypothetical protein HYY69_07995 [Candidatus Woesearchaeota archaeon]|nr:hypothetical protein [Candidatus Woesearchaeota archaeon]